MGRFRSAAGRFSWSLVLASVVVSAVTISTIAWPTAAPSGDTAEVMAKPRRQQGILTGMPFMANVASRSFVDDMGRKIYLAKAPTRVVSLAPSITEIIYAIGQGDRIVGVTPFCDYPPEAKRKPKVSYARPNLEAIVALQPDLAVAPREVLRTDLIAKLEQLKIQTFLLEANTVEDIYAHIQTLGRILEHSREADRVATDLRRRVMGIRQKTEGLSRPRTLYVLNSDPLITVGPGSFIHQLIGLAGGSNIAEVADLPYPRLSMEVVIKSDPEIIIFPIGQAEGIPEAEQERWRRWTTLTAVKRDRFHRISADLLNRPGPRIAEGLEALARIIHPEIFDQGV